MKRLAILLVLILCSLVACTPSITAPQVQTSLKTFETLSVSQKDATPSTIIDVKNKGSIAMSADVIKYSFEGKEIIGYGYNAQIPGPTLVVSKGSEITIDFTNNLPVDTTVHWHGLRLDNKFDGVPVDEKGHGTQNPVKPGESFKYEVQFPDSGVFWYHPHIREDAQQDLGLYGMIFVKDDTAPGIFDEEQTIILDDILLDESGIPSPHRQDVAEYAIMGRFGNKQLINNNAYYSLTIKKDSVVRMYVANVANVRPFKITIPGARMKLVASDLSAYEEQSFIDSLIIAPAERYTIDVYFDKAGTYKLQNANPLSTHDLGEILVTEDTTNGVASREFDRFFRNNDLQDFLKRTPIDDLIKKDPDHTMILDIDMPGMMHHQGMAHMETTVSDGIEWEDTMPMMNSHFTSADLTWLLRDNATGKTNMDFSYSANVGDLVKIRIVNPSTSMHPMQHPIHLHGQRFLILSVDGKPVENHVWKDTVLVPIGSTVDILVEVTNPGDWMLHCHIAEHLSSGMMTHFSVGKMTH